MMNPNSVRALIHLIDDPDEHIYEHVRGQLKTYGRDAIPLLENSWESKDFGLLFQHRIEELIHEIQFDGVKQEINSWIHSYNKDLLEGAILVAKYQYPGLDESKIRREIEQIKREIWLEINDHQTAFEQVKTFNKIFFDFHHFRGNAQSFHSPLNSFVNTVLETKKGNPLSLSLIYSVIAQNLGLPIFGVNLPNHFVLAYMDKHQVNQSNGKQNPYGVLFYINPYAKGSFFYEADIHSFLHQLKITPERSHFEPCSNTIIIKRMLTNLIASFQQVGNKQKVNELMELRALFPAEKELF